MDSKNGECMNKKDQPCCFLLTSLAMKEVNIRIDADVPFSIKMSLIREGYVVVLLLALTQTLVFASVDHGQSDTEDLNETIIRHLRSNFFDGLNWITRSPNTPGVAEARGFVRAVESRETWALRLLDVLRSRTEIPNSNEQDIKSHDQDDDVELDLLYSSSSAGVQRPSDRTEVAQILSGFDFNEPGNSKLLPDLSGAPFNTEEICTIIFFSTVVGFMIACTICDFVQKSIYKKSSSTMNTLAKFSLYTNALNLANTNAAPNTMPALHGMKFLSICIVVIAHRFPMLATVQSDKLTILDVLKWETLWIAKFVWLSRHAVDTFFVISGFLTAYHTLKAMKSGSKINVLKMYFFRYLRLTPSMAAVILIIIVLPRRLGSGVMWENIIISQSDACRENWWVNLLYLQNFVKLETLCLLPTWSLAAEMHLFLMSPLILYLLHRRPKFGLATIGVLFTASVISPAILIAIHGHHNGYIRVDVDYAVQKEFFALSYVATYPRGVPYLIGMLLGYEITNKRRLLSQVTVIVNWIVCVILLLLSTWLTERSIFSNFAYSRSVEAFYSLIIRPSWSIAVAWIVYACTQGYGGVAARFLSMPIFVPLSRLTYCILLVHIVIQIGNIAMTHASISIFGIQNIHGISGDILMSIVAAFLLSLFFESPSIVLKNILQNRARKSEPKLTMGAANPTVDSVTKIK